MKALSYLMITRFKNRILSLKKKPALLVLYLFILACVVFSVVILLVVNKDMKQMNFADERILLLILAGLGLLYLWMFTNTGLSTGSSLFTMPDVGLLFVAPISSKKILFYGLINTLGKSLLGSIFIFYQIGNLKSNFGYGFKEIFALFLIFALMVLFCQLLSIGIYIFSNGNPYRKKLVLIMLYSLVGVILVGAFMIQKQEQTGIMQAVLSMMDQSWFGYVPVAGWVTMFFQGVVQSSLPMILIPIILFFVFGGMIVSLLTMGTADYYEDVLVSTETTFNTLSAAKEGRSIPKANGKKIKIKDNEQGIKHGIGANTFLYKHILEMRRKSRIIFVDKYTLFLVLSSGVAGYYFNRFNAPSAAAYGILGTAVYMQFIFSMMGKLKIELTKPYIYLIPEKSIRKVFAASLSSLIKHGIDGILMFLILVLLGGTDPLTGLFSAIAYASSGAVFVALTILYQRVLGGQPNKLVQMFLGLGLLAAVMGPAIAVTIIAAILLPKALVFLCTLPFSIFCLAIAGAIFLACGNLIDKSEYTGRV
jgi:hypothetical protein